MKPLLALLALTASAFAETRNVQVSFYCLKYVPGQETIHVRNGDVLEDVRLSTANLTNPVTATVTDGEAFIHKQGGEPKSSPLAGRVVIPAAVSKALVVLVPSGGPEPYRSLVIDHGDSFKLGTYKVINFSQRPIRGAIGKSFIQAGAGHTTELELKGDAGTVQGVRFEFEKEGRWNRLTETRAAVRKDRRWLLCIFQDPTTERINMRSIPDRTTLLVPVSAETETGAISAN